MDNTEPVTALPDQDGRQQRYVFLSVDRRTALRLFVRTEPGECYVMDTEKLEEWEALIDQVRDFLQAHTAVVTQEAVDAAMADYLANGDGAVR